MKTLTFVITKGHEVVKSISHEVPESCLDMAESIEGQPFPMYGKYEGCMCELVGIE